MKLFFLILPWIMSLITITTLWLAGDKKLLAWKLGLFNQILWSLFIYDTGQYGLIPMTIAVTFVYIRNYIKFKRMMNDIK